MKQKLLQDFKLITLVAILTVLFLAETFDIITISPYITRLYSSKSNCRYQKIKSRLDQIARKNYDFKNLNLTTFLHPNPFNFEKDDVLVHLHIQKTGGTAFQDRIYNELYPCTEIDKWRLDCSRPGSVNLNDTWTFGRKSPDSWPCNTVHPRVDRLEHCLQLYKQENNINPNYQFITNLREPVERLMSEWNVVANRNSTWQDLPENMWQNWMVRHESPFTCKSKAGITVNYENKPMKNCWNLENTDPSLEKANWAGVELSDFLDCPYNLGFNRQVMMIGDIEKVGCHGNLYPVDSDEIMYNEAMMNLTKQAVENLNEKFAYFSIYDEPELSWYVFEQTFGIEFAGGVWRNRIDVGGTIVGNFEKSDKSVLDRINEINKYEVYFYRMAKQLFFERVKVLRIREIERLKSEDK